MCDGALVQSMHISRDGAMQAATPPALDSVVVIGGVRCAEMTGLRLSQTDVARELQLSSTKCVSMWLGGRKTCTATVVAAGVARVEWVQSAQQRPTRPSLPPPPVFVASSANRICTKMKWLSLSYADVASV